MKRPTALLARIERAAEKVSALVVMSEGPRAVLELKAIGCDARFWTTAEGEQGVAVSVDGEISAAARAKLAELEQRFPKVLLVIVRGESVGNVSNPMPPGAGDRRHLGAAEVTGNAAATPACLREGR